MKLSAWAKLQGISYKTAWRMWRSGQLPVPAEQLPTGTVIVHDQPEKGGAALYARVSSAISTEPCAKGVRGDSEWLTAQCSPTRRGLP